MFEIVTSYRCVPGSGSQRQAEVVPVHHGIEVDGDPPADDRDIGSRDGDRRPLALLSEQRSRRPSFVTMTAAITPTATTHATRAQASWASPRGRLIAANHTKADRARAPEGPPQAAVKVRSRWATAPRPRVAR